VFQQQALAVWMLGVSWLPLAAVAQTNSDDPLAYLLDAGTLGRVLTRLSRKAGQGPPYMHGFLGQLKKVVEACVTSTWAKEEPHNGMC
jgi:hypothetical protein